MVGRKWEDLDMDCLVNIFGRVGVVNLVLNVQYVCKSWYKATCIPQCWSILAFTEGLPDQSHDSDPSDMSFESLTTPKGWTILDFTDKPDHSFDSDSSDMSSTDVYGSLIDEESAGFVKKYRFNNWKSLYSFFKFVAKRGNVCVTHLKIPAICTRNAIEVMTNECPNIKTLQLSKYAGVDLKDVYPSLASKWIKLGSLSVSWVCYAREVLEQLSVHCKNFETLEILDGWIERDAPSTLVTYLPNLKRLSMRYARITKKNLITILKSLMKLEFLDARDCVGFDENDADILNATAHLRSAKLQGSRFYSYHNEGHYDFEDGLFRENDYSYFEI